MMKPLPPEAIETPGNVLIGVGFYAFAGICMLLIMWGVTRPPR